MRRGSLLFAFLLLKYVGAIASQLVIPPGANLSAPGGSIALACADLSVDGSVSFGAARLEGARDISIGAGGTVDAGTSSIFVGGNWSNSGLFARGTSSVSFSDQCATGTPAQVMGQTSFANLAFSSSVGRTFVIPTGNATSVSGLLALSGIQASPINIVSADPARPASLVLEAGASMTNEYATLGPNVTVSSASYGLTVGVIGSGSGTVTSTPSGISCGTTCSATFATGTAVVLSAAASATSNFAGWSGACSGTDPACQITMSASRAATASFELKPGLAAPPQGLMSIPGNGQAVFDFFPPSNTGETPIQSYSIECNPGAIFVSGTGSPLTLLGLANGTSYLCYARATNSAGPSLPSEAVSVTPSLSVPFALVAALSRKTHGAAGVYNIELDEMQAVNGNITVDPRLGDTTHELVFLFTGPVNQLGVVTARDSQNQPIGNAVMSSAGPELRVALGGINNATRVEVFVAGVNGSTDVIASLAFLAGDVNNTRGVTASDILRMKGRAGQSVDTSNFVHDIASTGSIRPVDVETVKAQAGSTAR